MPKGHFERTEAHRKAISEALKGKKKSPDAIRNNADAQRRRRPPSPETIEKYRQRMLTNNPMRGKHLSEEAKAKMSAAKMGKSQLLKKYGIDDAGYARQLAAGNRWCTYRKHFSPVEQFPSKQPVCIECRSTFYREQDLKRKYGITHEWYVAKLAEQGGVCAICREANISEGDKHFAVDHNHETGAVRGILCSSCNTVLGKLERIPDWFMAVSLYLSRYR